MIIAKINPAVNFTTQVGPFSSVTVTCEYMATATAEYKPGNETNPFKVMFGHFVYNDDLRYNIPRSLSPYVFTIDCLNAIQIPWKVHSITVD
jgi:hypothetical protein